MGREVQQEPWRMGFSHSQKDIITELSFEYSLGLPAQGMVLPTMG